MVASSTAMRWKNADLRSKITPSRGVCPRFLAISPLLPLQKSAIITRQSSIRRSRWARSCLRLLPPLQKSPIITRQSSIHSSRRAFLPYALLLPLQKSTIITRQSSIHSSRRARSCHTLCFFPFKNHQSSLDNHQSIPREGRSCHTLCFFPFKNQQSSLDNHQSIPREGLGLATRSASSPSKITNHHSTIINPSLAMGAVLKKSSVTVPGFLPCVALRACGVGV